MRIVHLAASAALIAALATTPATARVVFIYQAANMPARVDAFQQPAFLSNPAFSGGNLASFRPAKGFESAIAGLQRQGTSPGFEAAKPVALEPGNIEVLPEPGTWATFIVGFGFIGFAARRRRTARLPQR
ncbi:PEPxxWA-CTERM sorting domain-containing protein [Sandaracinobacteroides hominis]|uniref:PEPxxWA-CTERM sorting domain-containing protein n=1 Tax=Sandaracinobacteroides hominis TaxID=2780086 RepID=UPI001F1D88DD|nr:PEPxxWA-CTERM sorting domain-containing protein [Sandaracinobacteroides hominis]